MDITAAHVGFVLAAYGISAAVLGGLAIRTLMALKTRVRELEVLEAREVPRRKAGA
jgi:heme exporter protein CcmD